MPLLCTPCGTPATPDQLLRCDLEPTQESGLTFAFMTCDYQFTDITDLAEWQAAIAANDIVIAPSGWWGKALPSQTTHNISCGKTFTTQQGVDFAYYSNLVENVSPFSEQDFYMYLRTKYAQYRVIPITCGGRFLIADEYRTAITAAGKTPGMPFSWIVPPDYEIIQGEDNLLAYHFTLRIPSATFQYWRYLKPVFDYIQGLV